MNLNPEGHKVLQVSHATLENHLRTAAAYYDELAKSTRRSATIADRPAGFHSLADDFERSAAQCRKWADAIGNDSILVTT